jgi:pimeloyl-ACP methyl ester carboxylesterase
MTHASANQERVTGGVYPGAESYHAIMAIYNTRLAGWPVPFEEIELPGRYGRTHVVACGNASAPPLLLVHMAATPAFAWRGLIEPLAGQYRVYALDTIGDVGKSELADPRVHPRSGEQYSAWLCEVCDALHVEIAHVLGGSMGGWISMNHAAYAPHRVRRLALLVPMGLPPWLQTLRVLLRLMSSQFLASGKKTERLLSWLMGSDPVVREEVGEWMTAVIDFHCTPKLGSPLPLSAATLGTIRVPTLIMLGGRDRLVGNAQAAARRAREHIRDVEIEILPDACHAMSIEQPERVARRLLKFFDGGRDA